MLFYYSYLLEAVGGMAKGNYLFSVISYHYELNWEKCMDFNQCRYTRMTISIWLLNRVFIIYLIKM